MSPRIVTVTERAYQNLVLVANMLEYDSKHNAHYTVKDVYFDLGQNWVWTTICREGYRDCQILHPKEWEYVMTANSLNELLNVTRVIQKGEYFND